MLLSLIPLWRLNILSVKSPKIEIATVATDKPIKASGETFEVIFQGNEGDALEVFSGYKVTDENGDGMTYYKRGDP